MFRILSILLIGILRQSYFAEARAVISIDLGTEWMKIGIVSPGVPMEIVLNKESKRKTPAVISFKDGERTFGEDAVNVGVRFPEFSYKYVLDLLGKPFDHPIVTAYRKRFPYYNIEKLEGRDTPVFIHDKNTTFTPEEIIAQLLGAAKGFAEVSSDQPIAECVIIVPGYFNQNERRAVIEAASLANLKVLQLINDYTAIAINYGIFRRKEINETASYFMFFDMGAYSTKAAIVEYKTIKTKERGYVETVPQLHVIGVGYDRTLGGFEVTLRLREHLIKAWEKNGGENIRSNRRSMAKMLKEAERVKVVLSANVEHYAQIENLINDKDFKALVTREDLENLCTDLWKRAATVIERARLAASGVGDLAKGVIAGGAARTPALREVLVKTLGHEPSQGINADEAATLGAVYRAAALAKGYKVAPLNVKDAVIFPIQVVFNRTVDGNEKLVKRTLFGPMNGYPQKKVITFNKHTNDFTFYVNYADLDYLPEKEVANIGPLNLTKVSLKGVSKVQSKHTGENIDPKGIKAHFSLDDSGILNFLNCEFVVEKTVVEEEPESPLSKLGSTISKLFSSDSDTKEELKPESAENVDEQKINETVSQNATDKSNQTESDTKPAKPKVITLKEPVEYEDEFTAISTLTPDQFKASKAKIEELNRKDQERTRRETAINNLESFIVDMLMKLDMEEYSECGTKEEIEKIKVKCQETQSFLDEEGYDAESEVYETKLDELKKISNDLLFRHWEQRESPDLVKSLTDMLNQTSHFLKMAKNYTKDTNPDVDYFTKVEIESLEKIITETEQWLKKSQKEQGKLKKFENPILLVADIREKMFNLDREMQYMVNKMKIWKPKKPIVVKNDTETVEKTETLEEVSKNENVEEIKIPAVEIEVEKKEIVEEKVQNEDKDNKKEKKESKIKKDKQDTIDKNEKQHSEL